MDGRDVCRMQAMRRVEKSMTHSNSAYRYLQFLFALIIIANGCWFAFSQAFFGIIAYDDEGYMITSLLHYVKEGGLYTKTFTQYGPFYFYFQQTLHTFLNLPINHDGGRMLTLIYWVASSAISGFVVYRLTHQALLSSVAFVATLLVASVLKKEPGHPQEVVLLFAEIALGLSVFAGTKASNWVLFLVGVAGAFIALTKINVGMFFLGAVYFSCVCTLQRGALRTALYWAGAIPAVLMPVLLMRLYLTAWAKHYCELATASIALFLWSASHLEVEDPWRPKNLLVVFAGMFAGAALILAIALAQGILPASLLSGIILLPLEHPAVFYYPVYIPAWGMIAATILLLLIVMGWWFRNRLETLSNLLALVKILSGVAIVSMLVLQVKTAMVFALPLLPLLYWRTKKRASGSANDRLVDLFPRMLLSAMIVFQFLQAYPVGGSQLSIAFTPAVCWACVLIYDGFRDAVQESNRQPFRAISWLRKPAVASVLTLCFTGAVVAKAYTCFEVYDYSPTLNFPGASRIHVSRYDARIFGQLVPEIREHCDVLFTMPGMNSLNLWSGIPAPNGLNLTVWMTAFTKDEQNEIVRILRRHSRPCIVYNSKLLHFWMPGGPGPLTDSPIARYLKDETESISKVSRYELRGPKAQEYSQMGRLSLVR
jgi:hypothetical protein